MAREWLTSAPRRVMDGVAQQEGADQRSDVMPLDNRNLETGTVLRARYKGKEHTCEVVQTADGLHYRLDDGREFTSPSSAGKAAMDGVACNGWRFWSVQGTEPSRHEREPKAKKTGQSAKAKPRTKARAKKSAAKKPKGKAVRAASKGDSYGCGACGDTFGTMKAATKHAMLHTSS